MENKLTEKITSLLMYKRILEESEKIVKELSTEILEAMTGDKMVIDQYKVTRVHATRKTLDKARAVAMFPELNNEEFYNVSEYEYLKVN